MQAFAALNGGFLATDTASNLRKPKYMALRLPDA